MLSYNLEQLQALGFSHRAMVGVGAAVLAEEAALNEREEYFKNHKIAVEQGEEFIGGFAWAKPGDGTTVCRSDVISTAIFHIDYFAKMPNALSMTEEIDLLGAWPQIINRCLNASNWRQLLSNEDGTVVDGIDGSDPFEKGKGGCGIWVRGVNGWAVFVAFPSSEQYQKNGILCPFISVAEVNIGIAVWQPEHGWKKVEVCVYSHRTGKVGHGITIHKDPRYKGICQFLSDAGVDVGGSDWVFSIGHAVGEQILKGERGLYIHAELAPHDFLPAHVFFEAMGVEYFIFVADAQGIFHILPNVQKPTYFNPDVRLGICGGPDTRRVEILKSVVEGNYDDREKLLEEFAALPDATARFFVKAGSAN